MSDELDNDLKNRIREVFDNYQDDAADAGWLLLRQKFPEEKKQRVIGWWWYSAAAVLLLCLGTWFFYPQQILHVAYRAKMQVQHTDSASTTITSAESVAGTKPATEQNPQLAYQPKKQHQPAARAYSPVIADNHVAASTTVTSPVAVLAPPSPVISGAQPALAVERRSLNKSAPALNTGTIMPPAGTLTIPAMTKVKGINANKVGELLQPSPATVNTPTALNGLGNSKNVATVKPTVSTNPGVAIGNEPPATIDRSAQSVAKIKQPTQKTASTIADTTTVNNHIAQTAAPAQVTSGAAIQAAQQKSDALLKMMQADDARQAAITKKAGKQDDVKQVNARSLSVYAATYFNYAKGSENQVNVGAGFTSDFKISKKIKFSTGLAIAQNKLNYSNSSNLPASINQKVSVAAASSDVMRSNLVSTSFATVQTTTTAKNYNASLVGLDIPLNVKYEFNPQKSDTYVSLGVSSGTYINETYRSTYAYGPSANANVAGFALANSITQQDQQSTATQHFSTFDFAKTLNFSFGIGYPLGGNRLIIEPFVKYPLGGLGSQNISFGSSGVNLKLNFGRLKK